MFNTLKSKSVIFFLIFFLLVFIAIVLFGINRKNSVFIKNGDQSTKKSVSQRTESVKGATIVPPTPTDTPTPTPTQTPTPTPFPTITTTQELDDLFTKYSSVYSIDKELLKRIADCESHFNPQATSQDYAGMYQFSENSWVATRNEMGESNDLDLRFNAEESIKTAAFKVSRGGITAWPNCNK